MVGAKVKMIVVDSRPKLRVLPFILNLCSMSQNIHKGMGQGRLTYRRYLKMCCDDLTVYNMTWTSAEQKGMANECGVLSLMNE